MDLRLAARRVFREAMKLGFQTIEGSLFGEVMLPAIFPPLCSGELSLPFLFVSTSILGGQGKEKTAHSKVKGRGVAHT